MVLINHFLSYDLDIFLMFILNNTHTHTHTHTHIYIYIYIYKRAFVGNHSSEEASFLQRRDNNVVAPVGGTK